MNYPMKQGVIFLKSIKFFKNVEIKPHPFFVGRWVIKALHKKFIQIKNPLCVNT
jgi:hypothetical protein